MASDEICVVHHIGETYIILKPEHALSLRHQRIVSQCNGGGLMNPSVGPYSLSVYATFVVATHNLAQFRRLKLRDNISTERNKNKYEAYIENLTEKEINIHKEQRLKELAKRNILPTPDAIKKFDTNKLRLELSLIPDPDHSSFVEDTMTAEEVFLSFRLSDGDISKLLVFDDMYRRGFYVTSGMKFGGDFLAYVSDPVRYHAQYVLRVVQSSQDGRIDLSGVDYNNFNGFQRLTHTAHKIPLFVTVIHEIKSDSNLASVQTASVRYWTLAEREYLTMNSRSDDFDSIDPNPKHSNKVRRTV